MMSSKNSSGRLQAGFSLMEVLAAIAIFSIVMSPLFILQGSTYARMARSARNLHRIWFAQEFLMRAQEKIKADTIALTLDEKKDFPETSLHFELSAVTPDSPFASLKDLYVESVSSRWVENGQEDSNYLVTFVFKPQPKKEEKK